MKALKWLVGYSIWSEDYEAMHYSWTMADALEWMACYKYDDLLIVRKQGKLVAFRTCAN